MGEVDKVGNVGKVSKVDKTEQSRRQNGAKPETNGATAIFRGVAPGSLCLFSLPETKRGNGDFQGFGFWITLLVFSPGDKTGQRRFSGAGAPRSPIARYW